jgi:hypothetical protein
MAQLVQPIANGALVLSIDTDFDGCMKLVKVCPSAFLLSLCMYCNKYVPPYVCTCQPLGLSAEAILSVPIKT